MLGDVARWLRILGEDCLYVPPDWHDDEVLERARDEDRVIVSRDTELVRRAHNMALRAVEVPMDDTHVVLVQVYRALALVPDRSLAVTRCAGCNGALDEVDGRAAAERAKRHGVEPPIDEVLARHERFWSCRDCGQPYWRGSHGERIEDTRRRIIAACSGDA